MFGFRKKVKNELEEINNRIDSIDEFTKRMLLDQQRQLDIMNDVTKSLEDRISALEKRAH